MSVDALLTQASDELATTVARRLDGDGVLAALHRTRRRRHTATIGALIGALVVLALAVVSALGLPSARDRGPVQPLPPPRACAPAATTPCSGGGRFRVTESVPFVWTLPANYVTATHGAGHTLTYVSTAAWPDTTDASALADGVTVLIDAAATDAADPARAPNDPPPRSDAHSLALWLAARPFLASSDVRGTVVDGRPAWELDLRTRHLDAAHRLSPKVMGEHEGCGCPVLAVLLRQTEPLPGTPRDWLPVGEQSSVRVWLVDLPGGHVAAIRAADRSDPRYSTAQGIVDSVRFGMATR